MALGDLDKFDPTKGETPIERQTFEGVQTSVDVVGRIKGGIEDAMWMRNVGVLCDEYLSAEFGDYDAGLYNRLLSFVETETGCFEEGSINEVDFENLFYKRKENEGKKGIQEGVEEAETINVWAWIDSYLAKEFGIFSKELYRSLRKFIEVETGCFEEGSINVVDFENLCEARKKPRLEFISEIVEKEKKNKGGNK